MAFNTNSPAVGKRIPERISMAVECLRQGRADEAFLLLSEPGVEKEPAGCFALGLCYLRAGEPSRAISCFEQALNLFRVMPSRPSARTETGEIHLKLAMKQIAEKVYLAPMDAEFCALFPKAAEQAALMALIDSCLQIGMIEQARRFSAGLNGPEFAEYKNKLTVN